MENLEVLEEVSVAGDNLSEKNSQLNHDRAGDRTGKWAGNTVTENQLLSDTVEGILDAKSNSNQVEVLASGLQRQIRILILNFFGLQ